MHSEATYTWTIVEKRPEARNTWSFFLEPREAKPDFIAGQYLTVLLPHTPPVEGKAYSIASAPHEDRLQLTVRVMGPFSAKIAEHAIGDVLTTSAPYGFFYPENDTDTRLVYIAGGIGITPYISILKNHAHSNQTRPISLFYSNRTKKDAAFLKELAILNDTIPELSIMHFLTREQGDDTSFHTGHMSAESILKNAQIQSDADFFICGGIDFTKTLWRDLREHDIPQHQIYTEGFF